MNEERDLESIVKEEEAREREELKEESKEEIETQTPRRNPRYSKKKLGERLLALRKERKLSQFEFAQAVGMRDKAYIHYEKNRSNITIDNLLAIANVHDVSLESLFIEEDEE